MCDMPRYYPGELIAECMKRIEKGVGIHTLVLWTKHPRSLLAEPLKSFIEGLRRMDARPFFQVTITAMGGIFIGESDRGPWKIEPNAPGAEDSLAALADLVDLAGDPRRIKVRIDPILKVRDARGKEFSNAASFECVVESAADLGISDFSFSLLEPGAHAKVDRRFRSIGCSIARFSDFDRALLAETFKNAEKRYKVKIYACCVEGFDASACVDGKRLSELHPGGEPCDTRQPRRRAKCGCVKTVDLGGWPVKKCPTGCDYCYANPLYA